MLSLARRKGGPARRTKGEVRVLLSHAKTTFELEAKKRIKRKMGYPRFSISDLYFDRKKWITPPLLGRRYVMPTNVIMPPMGESIVEGTVTKWLKKVGERVMP